GDGQQRNQGGRLQQGGAGHAEQQAAPGGAGAARQQALEPAAGQLAQAFLQALHAEQEQGQAGAQLQPAGAAPETPAQDDGHGQGDPRSQQRRQPRRAHPFPSPVASGGSRRF